MFCAKLALSMFQLANFIIGVIRSNYINLHEIICSFVTKNYEKLKQLV
jgi:hypothetical protein